MYNNVADSATTIGAVGFTSIFGVIMCLIWLIAIVIGILSFILWIWMLVDAVQREDDQFGNTFGESSKLVWILLMVFFHAIISIVYYFIVYKKYPLKKK